MGKYFKEVNHKCIKKTLKHKKVFNAHPYGGDFELDECTVCKEKHNFKKIKRN